MDNITSLLVEHSILGIVLSFAFWWIRKQHAEARCERDKLHERIFELIEQTNNFDQGTAHQLTELRGEVQRLADRVEGRRP